MVKSTITQSAKPQVVPKTRQSLCSSKVANSAMSVTPCTRNSVSSNLKSQKNMSKSLQDNSRTTPVVVSDELTITESSSSSDDHRMLQQDLENASVKSKIKLMESIVGMTDSVIVSGRKATQDGHGKNSMGGKNERSASTSSATSSTSSYSSSHSPPLSPKACENQVLIAITNTNGGNNMQSEMIMGNSSSHAPPQASCSLFQVEKLKVDEKLAISNEKRKTVKELLSQFETTKSNV